MYDINFRKAALLVYSHTQSMRKTARILGISAASLCRWARMILPKGWSELPSRRSFKESMKAFVRDTLIQDPCTSCLSLQKLLAETFSIRVSRQLIGATIRSIGFSRKRVRTRACKLTPKDRQDHLNRFRDEIETSLRSGAKIVSLDESGFDPRGKSTFYGYAIRGKPAIVHGRSFPCKRVSLIMAICPQSGSPHVFRRTRSSTTDGASFADFVRDLPYEQGTCLILDNAAIHKTKMVVRRKRIHSSLHASVQPRLQPHRERLRRRQGPLCEGMVSST